MTDRSPEDYWRDDAHESLRVSFISVDGSTIREMGSHDFPAPLNKNTAATIQVRIEVVHADGCKRQIEEYPVRAY